MPMTKKTLACRPRYDWAQRTVVDRLELRDDVQSNVRELILEHLQEHGKQV